MSFKQSGLLQTSLNAGFADGELAFASILVWQNLHFLEFL